MNRALVLAAIALSAAAVVIASGRNHAKTNSYAATIPCVAPAARSTTSAARGQLVYATRDLSGAPDFGVCNVPTRPVDWIDGAPITLNGSTEVSVEFYLPAAEPDVDSSVVAYLYDGERSLGALTDSSTMNLQGGARDATTMFSRVYLTPTAGTHVFKIVLAAVGGTSNPVYSGSEWFPSYLRVARV